MEESGAGSGAGSVLVTDPDADPGGPSTYGSGSTTLLIRDANKKKRRTHLDSIVIRIRVEAFK
jgi:hypothetical protein